MYETKNRIRATCFLFLPIVDNFARTSHGWISGSFSGANAVNKQVVLREFCCIKWGNITANRYKMVIDTSRNILGKVGSTHGGMCSSLCIITALKFALILNFPCRIEQGQILFCLTHANFCLMPCRGCITTA